MVHSPNFTRRWLHFSIQALLFVILCTCGLLAGYRAGHTAGYSSGLDEVDRPRLPPKFVARTYNVRDLVSYPAASAETAADAEHSIPKTPRIDFKPLIQVLKTTIACTDWADVGGTGTVDELEGSVSISVLQTIENHKRIEDLLKSLRHDKLRTK